MQNFIILGIIPGTNVQVGFATWIVSCSCMFAVALLFRERHAIRIYFLCRAINRHIKQFSLHQIVLE